MPQRRSKKELAELERDWKQLLKAHTSNMPALACVRARNHLKRWPKNMGALDILGKNLVDLARYDEAKPVVQKGLRKAKPHHRHWFEFTMAQWAENTGNLRAAERWYRQAIRSSRETVPGLYVFLGALMARQGKFIEAKRAHRRSAVLCQKMRSPADADEPYLNLALIHRAEGKYTQALDFVNRAIKLDPKYAEAKAVKRDLLKTTEYIRNKRQKTRN